MDITCMLKYFGPIFRIITVVSFVFVDKSRKACRANPDYMDQSDLGLHSMPMLIPSIYAQFTNIKDVSSSTKSHSNDATATSCE